MRGLLGVIWNKTGRISVPQFPLPSESEVAAQQRNDAKGQIQTRAVQQTALYSITSSAAYCSVSGTVSPSECLGGSSIDHEVEFRLLVDC